MKTNSLTDQDARYDDDFFAWTQATARLLREGRSSEVDMNAVAEEIESLGRSDRREVLNRLAVLIMHLLKWEMQPERRSGSWSASITEQRSRLKLILDDSPSLRACAGNFIVDAYPRAVRKAVYQMRLLRNPFSLQCPYTVAEILDADFWPESRSDE
jgi:hypothetical protein